MIELYTFLIQSFLLTIISFLFLKGEFYESNVSKKTFLTYFFSLVVFFSILKVLIHYTGIIEASFTESFMSISIISILNTMFLILLAWHIISLFKYNKVKSHKKYKYFFFTIFFVLVNLIISFELFNFSVFVLYLLLLNLIFLAFLTKSKFIPYFEIISPAFVFILFVETTHSIFYILFDKRLFRSTEKFTLNLGSFCSIEQLLEYSVIFLIVFAIHFFRFKKKENKIDSDNDDYNEPMLIKDEEVRNEDSTLGDDVSFII